MNNKKQKEAPQGFHSDKLFWLAPVLEIFQISATELNPTGAVTDGYGPAGMTAS